LTPATRAAIGLFQRDQRLRQTGFLDHDTLDRLGLIGQGGSEVTPVDVVRAEASTQGNQLRVRIATRNTAGMQLFEDHFRQRDALHIYVRGYRASGAGSQPSDLNVVLQPDEWQGLRRVVVHGSGENIVIRAEQFNAVGGALTPEEADRLEADISAMLTQYTRALGVRYNASTGQIVLGRADYRENELELLFAINSLAASARLYSQIVRATTDPQAIAGAADVFVSQANQVDRVFARTRSGRATVAAERWQTLRDSFTRLGNNRQGSL
jgi:hypothetical protein